MTHMKVLGSYIFPCNSLVVFMLIVVTDSLHYWVVEIKYAYIKIIQYKRSRCISLIPVWG
jgi:hypothetical protein